MSLETIQVQSYGLKLLHPLYLNLLSSHSCTMLHRCHSSWYYCYDEAPPPQRHEAHFARKPFFLAGGVGDGGFSSSRIFGGPL